MLYSHWSLLPILRHRFKTYGLRERLKLEEFVAFKQSLNLESSSDGQCSGQTSTSIKCINEYKR